MITQLIVLMMDKYSVDRRCEERSLRRSNLRLRTREGRARSRVGIASGAESARPRKDSESHRMFCRSARVDVGFEQTRPQSP